MQTRFVYPIGLFLAVLLLLAGCGSPPVPFSGDADTPETAYARGKRLLGAGAYALARDAFAHARVLDEDYAPAYEGLSRVAIALGDRDEAVRQIRIAKIKDPNYPPAWIVTGMLYASAKRYRDAITEYQEALARDPDRLWAKTTYFLLSGVHRALDELDQAEAALTSAVALDPLFLEAKASLEEVRQLKQTRLRERYRRPANPAN